MSHSVIFEIRREIELKIYFTLLSIITHALRHYNSFQKVNIGDSENGMKRFMGKMVDRKLKVEDL